MPSPLEIIDETRTVRQAKLHGWLVRKLTFIGVRGAPDRIFGKDGRGVVIEFKRRGEIPGPQQMKRLREMEDAFGLEAYWTDNYETACGYLGIPV